MSRYIDPKPQYFLNNGDVASGGLLYFYENLDYLTPKNTYSADGDTNTNPVVLDGSGRIPEIYGSGFYSVQLKSSSGVLQWTRDNVELKDFSTSSNPLILGDLTFSSSGARIKGDFSNATISTRVIFQTSTPNSASVIGVMPSGSLATSAFVAYNNSSPDNSSSLVLRADSASTSLSSTKTGTGSYLPIRFATSDASRLELDISGNMYPLVDNAYSFGKAGARFTAFWAANGTIQTSDLRTKTNINDSVLGLDFINELRPVSYKFIIGQNEVSASEVEGGDPIVTPRAGQRTHYGLIAQEVKEAIDNAGFDFGGWILTDKNDPDSQQGLRYDQFISPLIKAVQELTARVEALEAQIG